MDESIDLINKLLSSDINLANDFNEWAIHQYNKSILLGMEMDDLIRVNYAEILSWITKKLMR
jgi:hypothetical protein